MAAVTTLPSLHAMAMPWAPPLARLSIASA